MDRRIFLRTALLGGLGAIFVPRYERWFRPIELVAAPAGLTLAWPDGTVEGDVAILSVVSPRVMQGLEAPEGWSLITRRVQRADLADVAVYSRVVGAGEPPPRLPRQARVGHISTFRGVVEPGRVNVAPSRDRFLLAGRDRVVPTYVGHHTVRRG